MHTLHAAATLALAGLGLLMACGGDSPGTEPHTTITVTGLVRDRWGEPIGGAALVVTGKTPVTSDADGRFSIPAVAVPYDLTLLLSSRNTALVYKGLTRADLALLTLDPMGAERSATISGATPLVANTRAMVSFQSGRNVHGESVPDNATGQYAMTVPWLASATTLSGRLHVLRWTNGPTGTPASYDAYATKPLTIIAGGDFPGNDFAAGDLTDPPEQSFGGTVVVPGGYSSMWRRLYVFLGRVPDFWDEQTLHPLFNEFTYTVPAVTGATFGVGTLAADPASRTSFFFKHGISGHYATLPMAVAALLMFPADGATAVDGATSFGWVQGGGTGVNLFEARPDNSSDPTYIVFTTGADATIPDLAGAGMALPPNAGYTWLVVRVFPVASVDDATSNDFLALVDLEAGDVGETVSETHAFTTKVAAGTAFRGAAATPPADPSASLRTRRWRLTPGLISVDGGTP